MLAELLNYGCIQQLKGLFHVTPMDKRPVGAPRSLVEATLWLDVETMKNVGFSDDQMHSYLGADNTTFAIGWILETAYDKVGGEEIIKRFKQRQEPK
jgi:hypothetical protein